MKIQELNNHRYYIDWTERTKEQFTAEYDNSMESEVSDTTVRAYSKGYSQKGCPFDEEAFNPDITPMFKNLQGEEDWYAFKNKKLKK